MVGADTIGADAIGTDAIGTDAINRVSTGGMSLTDKWILTRLQHLIQYAHDGIKQYRLSDVGEHIYTFLKEDFAAWYIEISKIEKNKDHLLRYIFETILQLLHPYTPYITETLWKEMGKTTLLAKENFPLAQKEFIFAEADEFENIRDLISTIRKERNAFGLENEKNIQGHTNTKVPKNIVEKLTGIQLVENKPEKSIKIAFRGGSIDLNIAEFIDINTEKDRLKKEVNRYKGQLIGVQKKLDNEKFIAHADPGLIEKERNKQKNFQNQLEVLEERLQML